MSERTKQRWKVWGAPVALALLTLGGLVAGLVGDGAWDAVSWIGLGAPILVCLWFGGLRQGRR
jgi:hypothetical protein